MHRNKSNGTWVVRKLIEQDHMNHHYRRLNGARSQLHLNNDRHSTISRTRLSKSSNDVRFEESLRNIETRMASEFCLNVSAPASEKKKEISDETLDVMTRHSQYFTQPKSFAPRIVRKIVRPNTATTIRPLSTTSNAIKSDCIEHVPAKLVNTARKTKKAVVSVDPERNLSADSAFGDEQFLDSSSSTSDCSQEMDAFNIKKWLREQEEENCYMQLMCDITADLLQRNLCTNGNMKEIIAIYIRKSRNKFSTSKEILMKKLCEDLMIPNDNSFNDQFYGSTKCKAVSTYPHQTWRDNKEDIRMFYNEIKPTDNYLKCGVDHNEISKKYHSYNTLPEKRSFVQKTQSLGEECPTFECFDDKPCAALKSKNHNVKDVANSQHAVPIITNTCQKKDIPDVDGYFSDFTNDTDNDIEEEFDFD